MDFKKTIQLIKSMQPEEKLVIAFSFFGIASALTMTISFVFAGKYWVALKLGLFGIGFILPIFLQLISPKKDYAPICILVVAGLAILAVAEWDDGLVDDAFYWLAVLPLVGGLLLKRPGILYTSLFSMVVLAVYGIRDYVYGVDVPILAEYLEEAVAKILFNIVVPSLCWQFMKVNDWLLNARTKKIDTLLRIVSHDIANPLMVIHGMSETLMEKKVNDRVDFAISRIHASALNIRRILERVKSIQAIKSGKITVELTPISIQEMFEAASTIFEKRLKLKHLSLKLNVDHTEDDIFFLAEPVTFLNDVLNNLISNAIKFSHVGSTIEINIGHKDNMVHLSVRDYGIGMPRQLRKDVFDDFKQTSRMGTEGEEGTGFGLPITKFLVNVFGGYIEVESWEEKDFPDSHGTCFHVYLQRCDRPQLSQAV